MAADAMQRTYLEEINRAGERGALGIILNRPLPMKLAEVFEQMKIGDTLCVYTHVERVGRTSMTLKVEAWAQRYLQDLMEKVTHADFVMVALDADGRPTPVEAR